MPDCAVGNVIASAAGGTGPANPKDRIGPVRSRGLARPGDPGLADTPTGNRVRVLVAYTADAQNLTSVNLGQTMQELIDLAVLESNQGYANSGVTLRVELACLYETVFNESAAIENDVDRFRNNGDGFMDEVHTLRTDYDADMCCLVIDGRPDWCGWAYDFDYTSYGNMFQATVYVAPRATTLSPEFGHTQGCRHEPTARSRRSPTAMASATATTGAPSWPSPAAPSARASLLVQSQPQLSGSPTPPCGPQWRQFASDNRSALNVSDNTVVDQESPLSTRSPHWRFFRADEDADRLVTGTLTVEGFTAIPVRASSFAPAPPSV
jgi:hypothetical protein